MMKNTFIDMPATGQRIRELRKENGLTVEQLSDLLEFQAPRAIYKWQRGETLPTLDNLVALASILHTSLDDIVVTR